MAPEGWTPNQHPHTLCAVAVNLVLADARAPAAGDPLKRTWVGWKDTANDDELWEINRGMWGLGPRVDRERIATLSYAGAIRVVAEITARTGDYVGGRRKWFLTGTVLRPGDPVHDALMGAPAPPGRSPVQYFDTTDLEALTPAERASYAPRTSTTTMVVTWNPKKWNPNDWATVGYPQEVAAVAAGGLLRGQWSTGSRNSGIEPGDRVFFLRQGVEPRGIIGSGAAASRIFQAEHWDDERAGWAANYVLIHWDTLLLPEDGLAHGELLAQIPDGGTWRPQASGWVLPETVASELKTVWARHLGHSAPQPRRTAPRQRWQMDPARRKKVEDAAQDRLMAHYRQMDWRVKDVRHGNPYDAIATIDGKTLWLEAKGTETAGASVIVTAGEVKWAREHPGHCVLGVLSDVTFLPNDNVDPASGTLRTFNWEPDSGVLDPRDFDFSPDRSDLLGRRQPIGDQPRRNRS